MISHKPVTRSDLRQERSFFGGSVSTLFAAGCSTKKVLWSKINLIVSYVSYFKFAARAIKPHFHATCFFGNQSITEIDTVICTAVYHLVKKMTISMHKHALSQLH